MNTYKKRISLLALAAVLGQFLAVPTTHAQAVFNGGLPNVTFGSPSYTCSDSITVNWQPVSGAVRYHLYYQDKTQTNFSYMTVNMFYSYQMNGGISGVTKVGGPGGIPGGTSSTFTYGSGFGYNTSYRFYIFAEGANAPMAGQLQSSNNLSTAEYASISQQCSGGGGGGGGGGGSTITNNYAITVNGTTYQQNTPSQPVLNLSGSNPSYDITFQSGYYFINMNFISGGFTGNGILVKVNGTTVKDQTFGGAGTSTVNVPASPGDTTLSITPYAYGTSSGTKYLLPTTIPVSVPNPPSINLFDAGNYEGLGSIPAGSDAAYISRFAQWKSSPKFVAKWALSNVSADPFCQLIASGGQTLDINSVNDNCTSPMTIDCASFSACSSGNAFFGAGAKSISLKVCKDDTQAECVTSSPLTLFWDDNSPVVGETNIPTGSQPGTSLSNPLNGPLTNAKYTCSDVQQDGTPGSGCNKLEYILKEGKYSGTANASNCQNDLFANAQPGEVVLCASPTDCPLPTIDGTINMCARATDNSGQIDYNNIRNIYYKKPSIDLYETGSEDDPYIAGYTRTTGFRARFMFSNTSTNPGCWIDRDNNGLFMHLSSSECKSALNGQLGEFTSNSFAGDADNSTFHYNEPEDSFLESRFTVCYSDSTTANNGGRDNDNCTTFPAPSVQAGYKMFYDNLAPAGITSGTLVSQSGQLMSTTPNVYLDHEVIRFTTNDPKQNPYGGGSTQINGSGIKEIRSVIKTDNNGLAPSPGARCTALSGNWDTDTATSKVVVGTNPTPADGLPFSWNVTTTETSYICTRATDMAGNVTYDYPRQSRITYDTTPPTITVNPPLPTAWTSSTINTSLTCTDNLSNCQSLEWGVSNAAGTPPAVWNTCATPAGPCAVALNTPGFFHTRATDGAINTTLFVPGTQIKYDITGPASAVTKVDGIATAPSAYPTNKDMLPIEYTLSDAGIGTLQNCSVTFESNTQTLSNCAAGVNTASINLATLFAGAPGTHTVVLRVEDGLGNPSTTAQFQVNWDKTAPTITGALTSGLIELDRHLNLTMPTAYDDLVTGTGVDHLEVELLDQNNSALSILSALPGGQDPHKSMTGSSLLTTTDPLVTIHNSGNKLIILPNASGQFTNLLQFSNVADKLANGTQAMITAKVTVYDKATNPRTVSGNATSFDTLAPVALPWTKPPTSTLRGDGTSDTNKYRVGADKQLPLVLQLKEVSNSSTGALRSLPLTITKTAGLGTMSAIPTGTCDTDSDFDSATGICEVPVTITVGDNFDGPLVFSVRDYGYNISADLSVYVRQDSTRPVLTGDITTPGLAAGAKYKSSTYNFEVNGLTDADPDPAKKLYAMISYVDDISGVNATRTIERQLTLKAGTTDTYTFSAELANVKYGAQNLSIYFIDEYGNRHQDPLDPSNPTPTKSFPIFIDNRAPEIVSLVSTWVNNDAKISWSDIQDDSYPIKLVISKSSDGTNWTPVSTTTYADANAAKAVTATSPIVVTGVGNNEQLRLEFTDTVKAFDATAGIIDSSTPETRFIVKFMTLEVSENPSTESIDVSYAINPVNISEFSSLTVVATDPHNKQTTFNVPSLAAANGIVGTITPAMKGNYTLNSTLNYVDTSKAPFQLTRIYTQANDIVTPQGTLSVTEVPNVIIKETTGPNTGRYIVKSSATSLDINYLLAPEYIFGATTIYDDSTTLTIRVEGTDASGVQQVVINPNTAHLGTIPITLNFEKEYTIKGIFQDAAGNSSESTIKILRKYTGPNLTTQLLDSTNAPITMISSKAGESDVLLTKSVSDKLLLTLQNSDNIAQKTVKLDTVLVTGNERTDLATATSKTYEYAFNNLSSNSVHVIDVHAVDEAINSSDVTLKLRVDTDAPQLNLSSGSTGLSFPTVWNNTTLPALGIDATNPFNDYSPIFYRIVENGVTGPKTSFSANAITLPEGSHTFTVIFEDQLGNQTTPYGPFTSRIDTSNPVGTITFPSQGAGGAVSTPTIVPQVTSLTDASTNLTYEMYVNAQFVGTGSLLTAGTFPQSLIPAVLTPSQVNTITVTLIDEAQNRSTPFTQSYYLDTDVPVVSNYALNADATFTNAIFSFLVKDPSNTALGAVTAQLFNKSTGVRSNVFTPTSTSTPAGFLFSGVGSGMTLYKGHTYVLEVSAQDILGNGNGVIQTATGTGFVLGQPDYVDNNDPKQDVIPIDLTGLTGPLTVVIKDADGNTVCTALNVPLGTELILGEVLARCSGGPVTLPPGTYSVTVTDANGIVRTATITVDPYFMSPTGDINGDGFAAGLSDEKLYFWAFVGGKYISPTLDATEQAKLDTISASIKSALQNSLNSDPINFIKN